MIFGRGWCRLFNREAREEHEVYNFIFIVSLVNFISRKPEECSVVKAKITNRMSPNTTRLYSGPEDLGAILAFVKAVRPAERLYDYPGPADLREELSQEEFYRQACLWSKGERLLAYAYVDPFHNLRFDIHPAFADQLGPQIVAWGVNCLRAAHKDDKTLILDSSCAAENAERIAFLKRHGFDERPERTLKLSRSLLDPLPGPVLPPGFTVRGALGPAEAESLAALHRAAFGTDYLTTERRLAWMAAPGYQPELDLVVLAPDGTPAAYCLCQIDTEQNALTGQKAGSTDPVGTHPRYQGLGLATALLLYGMSRLKARGMQVARLGTSSQNLPMQRAAQKAGFTVKAETVWFQKLVD